MAIYSTSAARSSVLSGITGSGSYCATCGKAGAVTSKAYSGGYTGRGSGSDAYVCATCGKSGSSSTSGTTYGSSSCPTCGKTGAASCPTCGKSSASSGGYSSSSSAGGTIYGSTNWAR
ncbi:MAG: hypothetical protein LBN39_09375 [Planctomycetaceae bacterium]|nr:hypothetical protein [Planctomycetaceae bacterium]